MSILRSIQKVPSKYDPAYLKMLVERIRTAVNNLDANNFPRGLSGTVVLENSINVSKLAGIVWDIPILSLADPKISTSVDLISVGGFVPWSANWGSEVELYLAVSGSSNNILGIATYELHNTDGKIASVTVQSGTYVYTQSEAFAPPSTNQSLIFKMKTNNAQYPVGVLNAHLIIVPK